MLRFQQLAKHDNYESSLYIIHSFNTEIRQFYYASFPIKIRESNIYEVSTFINRDCKD